MPLRKLSRYIDEPVYFLLWPLPEAIPILSGISLGAYFGYLWFWAGLGFLLSYLLRKYNRRLKANYLGHFFYYYGLLPLKAFSVPNPFVLRFTYGGREDEI
ncbi:type IV conjugative transfer system protein TraL [Psittacicella gerlachiana]|nr:type IV conjugative transfer system protein TraL [Psittacicella gerlachiana]